MMQKVGKTYGLKDQRKEGCLLLGKSTNETTNDHGDSQDQKLTGRMHLGL